MGRLDSNQTLKKHLYENKPFRYAHLVKFERPSLEEDITPPNEALKFDTGANKYAYFTDAAFDIKFQDGSTNAAGAVNPIQNYTANRVKKVGTLSESTQVKMGSANLVLDATATHISIKGDYTYTDNSSGSTITLTSDTVNYSAEGFKEDDKIKIPIGTVAVNGTTSSSINVTVDNFTTTNRVVGLLLEGPNTSGHLEVASWSGNSLVLSSPQSLPNDEVMTLFNYARITSFTNGGKTINAVL